MGRDDSFGYMILNEVVAGWNLAGVTTWNPKGTPVIVPQVPGGLNVPGAALRESIVPGVPVVQSRNYSNALVSASGNFISPDPSYVLNRSALSTTPDFTFSNAPFIFPNVRNPGSFYTDATLLKNFPFSAEGSRYFE